MFPIKETYAPIRSLQSQCLVSYKQGANGEEDFVTPERKIQPHPKGTALARAVWEKNRGKPEEINTTLQLGAWGYNKADDGKHRCPDEVMKLLTDAPAQNANLLLSTGPLGDGSIHPKDIKTLREVDKKTGINGEQRKSSEIRGEGDSGRSRGHHGSDGG